MLVLVGVIFVVVSAWPAALSRDPVVLSTGFEGGGCVLCDR